MRMTPEDCIDFLYNYNILDIDLLYEDDSRRMYCYYSKHGNICERH